MKFSEFVGASAIMAGIAYILGLILLALFFAGNDPFGAMSDRWIIVTNLLLLPLILGLYYANKIDNPATSLLALILGLTAVAVSCLGSYLFITRQISFRESLLPGMGGMGLTGLWVFINALNGRSYAGMPRALTWFGLLVGLGLALFLPFGLFSTEFMARMGLSMAGSSSMSPQVNPLLYPLFFLMGIGYLGFPFWLFGQGRLFLSGLFADLPLTAVEG